MTSFVKFSRNVRKYDEKYRHPDRPRLEISDPYDLVKDWKDYYPHCEHPGIYSIFDKEEKLLYVGKGSAKSSLGTALGKHFKGLAEGEFSLKDESKWGKKHKPRFVITVKAPKAFEVPSLEEYLITSLRPPLNIQGT